MQSESNVTVTVTENTTSVNESVSFETLYNSMVEQLNNAYSTVKSVKANLKMLETRHKKELKQSRKNRRRVVNTEVNTTPKNPSGFNKPGPVPQKIKDLLNLDSSIELPRTQITKLIYGYIKEHNLQKPTDKRVIVPNTEIRNLFGISDTETTEISFYNIQTYIKKLYPTSETSTTTTETKQETEHVTTSATLATPATATTATTSTTATTATATTATTATTSTPVQVIEQVLAPDTTEQVTETIVKTKSTKNKKKVTKKTNTTTTSAVASA
jgi:chromatin remodeling complex protein RSC6